MRFHIIAERLIERCPLPEGEDLHGVYQVTFADDVTGIDIHRLARIAIDAFHSSMVIEYTGDFRVVARTESNVDIEPYPFAVDKVTVGEGQPHLPMCTFDWLSSCVPANQDGALCRATVTIDDALAAVRQDGYELQNVPNELMCAEVCVAAVRQDSDALDCVPPQMIDPMIAMLTTHGKTVDRLLCVLFLRLLHAHMYDHATNLLRRSPGTLVELRNGYLPACKARKNAPAKEIEVIECFLREFDLAAALSPAAAAPDDRLRSRL